MKLSLAKKRKRQQQLLEESGGIDMRQVHDIMMEEDRLKAENKARPRPQPRRDVMCTLPLLSYLRMVVWRAA
jgi:hypothetical protein